MPGERQLLARGEDAQAVVRFRGLQKKSRLRKIRPAGDALHGHGIEFLRADDNRDRVAAEWRIREHVDLLEAIAAGHVAILERIGL